MGNIHDATPIFGLLQADTLTAIPTTTQVGMADQAHVLAFDAIGCTGAHPDPLHVNAYVVDSPLPLTDVVHPHQ
jgi:hypothetical protein